MARYKQGILGAFSGKIGPVIGSIRYGKPYMRARSLNPKNPRTPKQQRQRNKMALTINLLKRMKAFIHIGWRQHQQGRSAFNAATSYILKNVITGNKIDYSNLLVSSGTLTSTTGAKAVVQGRTVEVTWTDNSGSGTAEQSDKVLIAVINPAKNEVITVTEKVERQTGHKTVILPEHWRGDQIHTYLGFASQDGTEVANSIYLGAEMIKTDSLQQTGDIASGQVDKPQAKNSYRRRGAVQSVCDRPPKGVRFG